MQGFLAEGLQRTSAGLGSIIIDSQPITVALLASLFLGERLRPLGYGGLAIGVLGLLMLELPADVVTGGLPALSGRVSALGFRVFLQLTVLVGVLRRHRRSL